MWMSEISWSYKEKKLLPGENKWKNVKLVALSDMQGGLFHGLFQMNVMHLRVSSDTENLLTNDGREW